MKLQEVKCRVEVVNKSHAHMAKLESKKFMWDVPCEARVIAALRNPKNLCVVRFHKDTIVFGIFIGASPKSYRRYIILKRWLIDPYLSYLDKVDDETARSVVESILKDVINRPENLKDFKADKQDPPMD